MSTLALPVGRPSDDPGSVGAHRIAPVTAIELYYRRRMGHPEQLAQRTFAEETERVTGGAAGWRDPPEIRLEKVQADGFLVIRQPHLLQHLPAPWPEAQPHVEVMIELKLAGNHLDRREVARAQLRR